MHIKKNKTEVLYGIHPVLEALKAGRREIYEIFTVKDKLSKRVIPVIKLAEKYDIPVSNVKPSLLRSMAGSDMHQGIGARVDGYPVVEFSEILKIQAVDQSCPLLLLDTIEDPHNLGALIRTALCAGITGIIIPKDRSASPTPAVSKASAGALEHVQLSRVTNLVNTIKALKEEGLWIAGLDSQGDSSLYDCDLAASVAIVVGGEGKGIRPLVKKQCDILIAIPQTGPVNSLNASVAGAVVMYEAYRQRTCG